MNTREAFETLTREARRAKLEAAQQPLFGVGVALLTLRPEWSAVLDLDDSDPDDPTRAGELCYARCWVDGRLADCGVDRSPRAAVERLYENLRKHKGLDS